MHEHVLFFSFLIGTSVAFALVEIHVEGSSGWAERLPTWRVDNPWVRALWDGRPLTGYHLYVTLFVLLMAHLPYGLALASFSRRAELRILAFLFLFWIAEDFLWFVLNPAFGLKKFRREHVWWHAPTWWWIMPRAYWVSVPLGVLCYVLSLR
jgi:hypothetical protein